MGLDCVLADVKLFGDLAVTHALGDQFEDLEFAPCDAETLPFFLVRDEGTAGWNLDLDLVNNDFLLRFGQSEAEPDAQGGKGRGDQTTVDFERVLNDQKS